jgi:MFS superfamily sulfate permease-like transporter
VTGRGEHEGDSAHGADPRDESPFQPAPQPQLIERAVPVSGRLAGYRAGSARRDLLAGMTVAALAIPSAMAYAELAGVDPVNGLYALLLPAVAYALLGSSRQLIVGPEGSLAALTSAAVLGVAVAGSAEAAELAALIALLAGGFFLVARLLLLGWIADYFSRPVLIGYIHGVAVVLIVGQLGKLLGVSVDATDPLPQLAEIARELDEISWSTVLVSVVSLTALLLLRALAPKVPASLIVVVGAIAVSWVADLAARGVAVVGDVPAGLPSISFPTPPLSDAMSVVPDAAGLFLVCFADAILTARAYAGKHGEHVRVGQELLAVGAANAASGITSGIPVGGDQARDLAARPIASLTAVREPLAPWSPPRSPPRRDPSPRALARRRGRPTRAPRPRSRLRAPPWAGRRSAPSGRAGRARRLPRPLVVLTGVLTALLFAVGLSIVDAVRRSARPHDAVLGWVERLGRYADVSLHTSARLTPGVVVYRLDDRLFFANASYVKGRVREALRGGPTPARRLVFDAEGMTYVDATGADALLTLVSSLRSEGVEVCFARVKQPVRETLAEAGVVELVGADRFFGSVRDAVDASAAELGIVRSG